MDVWFLSLHINAFWSMLNAGKKIIDVWQRGQCPTELCSKNSFNSCKKWFHNSQYCIKLVVYFHLKIGFFKKKKKVVHFASASLLVSARVYATVLLGEYIRINKDPNTSILRNCFVIIKKIIDAFFCICFSFLLVVSI